MEAALGFRVDGKIGRKNRTEKSDGKIGRENRTVALQHLLRCTVAIGTHASAVQKRECKSVTLALLPVRQSRLCECKSASAKA